MKPLGYSRAKKLKQKKDISLLFEKGKWKTVGPLRIIHIAQEENSIGKFGVSVSKRHFKKATDRNRIKRLLREAYRLNRNEFEIKFGSNSLAMLFWASPHMPTSYEAVSKLFLKLCDKSSK